MTNFIAAFPRAPHRVWAAVAMFIASFGLYSPFSAITSGQDRPAATTNRNIVVAGTLFEPLLDEASVGNGGLFVGVNQFTVDSDVQPLRFAVNDAVEQCHLFVTELKLLPARQCYLALSGDPAGERVTRHLAELKQLGVQVVGAEKSTILRSFVRARQSVRPNTGLLVVSFSSHGFTDKRVGYVMPSDGLRTFLEDTAIRLSSVEEQMNSSQAGHRLLLVDACQERLSDSARSTSMPGGQTMSADFLELLKKPTGQMKLASCDVGEFSYEHSELGGTGHGVFTYAVLEALRGGAAADAQNVVRLSAVASYVKRSVEDWTADQNRRRRPGDPEKKQSPSSHGPEAARDLPLARKAGDLATLVASVRRQPLTEAFTVDLRGRLATTLGQLDLRQESDRELVSSTRGFVNNMLPANVFVAYLRAELDRRNRPSPPPVPAPVVATFTVREGADDSSPLSSGASVELQWQSSVGSSLESLGQAVTDARGRARIELKAGVLPTSSGRYFARVSKGASQRDWTLEDFPATSSWRLYLPRPPTPVEPGSVIENSIGAKLVLIPAGEFQMGSPASDTDASEDERPQHRVRLSKPYYLGKYEVSQREWKAVMGTEPWKGKEYVREGDDYPATHISHEEAEEFCRRLSARPAEKAAGRVYRLPTEAEWEYGCRGGNKQWTRYHFGDGEDELGEYAWYDKNAWDIQEKYAHIVGQKRANGYGLHDMHGNVYEWCSDWYSESYYATTAATTSDPTGPSEGSDRCIRGGSFSSTAWLARCADRIRSDPSSRDNYLGFRVAASPMGPPASGANK